MTNARNAVDETLDELHELRLAADAEFNHDPRKFLAHLREAHEQFLRKGWVEAPPPPPDYLLRVREALARTRRYPHLLDRAKGGRSAGGADERVDADG